MVAFIKKHGAVWGKIILSFVMVMILMTISVTIMTIITLSSGASPEEAATSVSNSMFVKYLQCILFIVGAYAMYVFFERQKGWTMGLKQQHGSRNLIYGALAGIILVTLSTAVIRLFGGISWEASAWNTELSLSLLEGFLLFSAVAISEEIYSRGYIQGLLRYNYGTTAAIIISSLLFALLHGMNQGVFNSPIPFINLILAGVIMALARELTGGLWWPIGLHLTWNFFQGYIYGFNVSGVVPPHSVLRTADNGPAWLSGGTFGIEGSLISIVLLIIGIIGVYFLYLKKTNAPAQQMTL